MMVFLPSIVSFGVELTVAVANKVTLNRDNWKHTWEVVYGFVCGEQLRQEQQQIQWQRKRLN
jgi:hypothetical protein